VIRCLDDAMGYALPAAPGQNEHRA
jgi:hypothetical protein